MNKIQISRGLINPTNPNDHQAKSVRLTLTPQAIRQNKFDLYSAQFDQGYPFNDVYYFCNQNLTSVYKYGSAQYTKNPLTGNISLVNGLNSINLCANGNPVLCTTVCTPPLSLDPVSCQCVPPTECIPQPECTPLPIPLDLKNIVNGYAYYVDTPRSVPVPGFGDLPVTCWGGHACCSTKFKPKIVTSTGQIIVANRNISMDNLGCGTGQTLIPGFVPSSSFERSDAFSFIVPDPSVLSNSEFYLECLEYYCHTGVTMVFLVGETLGGDPVLLFAGCVTPTIEGAKPIGTVDCDTISEPVLCNPPPPPPPPPTPTSPTEPPCIPLSESSSVNISMPSFSYWTDLYSNPDYTAYIDVINNWMRSIHNIPLTSSPTLLGGELIEQIPYGSPGYGLYLVGQIVFTYLGLNDALNISITITNPFIPVGPQYLVYAGTSGWIYGGGSYTDQCQFELNNSQSGGMGLNNNTITGVILATT